jgi:hypothetical protein
MNNINYAMSDDELKQISGLPITVFPDIKTKNGIPVDQILLYETDQNNGHWVLIMNKGDYIEYFDSYGALPDAVLKFNGRLKRKQLKQQGHSLSHMILDIPTRYNDYQLQNANGYNATCGKWCVLRYLLKHLNEYEFEDLFKCDTLQEQDELVNCVFNIIYSNYI